jgi:hypothetical protein
VIYFVVFTLFALGAFFEIFKLEYFRNLAFFIFLLNCLILSLVRGLRWNTGTDWYPYLKLFEEIGWDNFLSQDYEIGFLSLNLLIKLVYNNYTFYLTIFNAILIAVYAYGIKFFTPKLNLVFLTVISSTTFFPVRQHLVIALFIFGSRFIIQQKFLNFFIVVLICFSLHKSAILLLPFYFILNYEFKFSLKKVLFLILISVFISYNISFIIFNFLNLLGNLNSNFLLISRLLKYSLDDADYSFVVLIVTSLKTLFFLFLGFKVFKNKSNKYFYINTLLIFSIINFAFLFVAPELGRFAQYFIFVEFLIIPFLLDDMSFKMRLLFFPLILVFFYIRFIGALNMYPDLFLPYYSIFDFNNYRFTY